VLQHLGGIHSGCALSTIIWLIYQVVDMFRHMNVQHDAILVTGVVTIVADILSALAAIPWVRNTHHKSVDFSHTSGQPDDPFSVFERNHRFIGWFGLLSSC
jgi:hypothetical protein